MRHTFDFIASLGKLPHSVFWHGHYVISHCDFSLSVLSWYYLFWEYACRLGCIICEPHFQILNIKQRGIIKGRQLSNWEKVDSLSCEFQKESLIPQRCSTNWNPVVNPFKSLWTNQNYFLLLVNINCFLCSVILGTIKQNILSHRQPMALL